LAQCTLRLGDRTVLVADGGVPEAEYALFDPGDIELGATEPGIIREVGLQTVVGTARARLQDLGLGADEAHRAAEAAAQPGVARSYARGAAVRRIVHALDAVELFEGGAFNAALGTYEGSWLDLATLSEDLAVPAATCTLQALHLAALLAEHDDDEPVVLSTAEVTSQRKPGQRTHRRPRMADAEEVVRALATLRPGGRKCEAGPCPKDIASKLGARTRRTPASRDRLKAVEKALAARDAPAIGPLADPELWAIEIALSESEPRLAIPTIDAVEQRRGRIPATTYLRARAALLMGSEKPRAIAERASALSTSMSNFHELQLLSAQAWAAAGEPKRAVAFARDLVENGAAPDSIRMHAQDLLGATQPSRASPSAPPSAHARVDAPSRAPSIPPGAATSASRSNASRPATPPATEGGGARGWSLPPAALTSGEPLESLGLPAGAVDAGFDSGSSPSDVPRTPLEARVHCTLLARELGRALREDGAEPRCDVDGLEMAQRHLRETLPEAGSRPLRPDEQRQLVRHGALLSELLARKLGARWVDLGAPDPQRWTMSVPSASRAEATRLWPFARVARFAAMGHKERDLVSYYLEVEARTRGT
jgi:hypothetical protein